MPADYERASVWLADQVLIAADAALDPLADMESFGWGTAKPWAVLLISLPAAPSLPPSLPPLPSRLLRSASNARLSVLLIRLRSTHTPCLIKTLVCKV